MGVHTGAEWKANNNEDEVGFFDWMEFSVGHTLTGEFVEVEKYMPSWGVKGGSQAKYVYRADLYAPLVIRVTYHATSLKEINFWINLDLHKKGKQ